jgi:hypothetical protein
MTMSGASATSLCVPSSCELDTSARFTPALRSSSAACSGGTTSHASWLQWMCASTSGNSAARAAPANQVIAPTVRTLCIASLTLPGHPGPAPD